MWRQISAIRVVWVTKSKGALSENHEHGYGAWFVRTDLAARPDRPARALALVCVVHPGVARGSVLTRVRRACVSCGVTQNSVSVSVLWFTPDSYNSRSRDTPRTTCQTILNPSDQIEDPPLCDVLTSPTAGTVEVLGAAAEDAVLLLLEGELLARRGVRRRHVHVTLASVATDFVVHAGLLCKWIQYVRCFLVNLWGASWLGRGLEGLVMVVRGSEIIRQRDQEAPGSTGCIKWQADLTSGFLTLNSYIPPPFNSRTWYQLAQATQSLDECPAISGENWNSWGGTYVC